MRAERSMWHLGSCIDMYNAMLLLYAQRSYHKIRSQFDVKFERSNEQPREG